MRVNTTIDCIQLNGIEQTMLLILKGIFLNYWLCFEGTKDAKKFKNPHITVSETWENSAEHGIKFHITDSRPGIHEEFEKALKTICTDVNPIAYFDNEKRETVIAMRRFQMKRIEVSEVHYVKEYTPKTA